MRTRKLLATACLALCSLATVASSLPSSASRPQKEKPRSERYSALAYLPSGAGMRMVGAGATASVDITINAYSTDAETEQMAQTLLQGGPEDTHKALEKMKGIGRVSLTGRVGFFELKLIRSRPLAEGGRRIVGVSDRPIGFLEAYASGRSTDYDYGILVLELKPNKHGKEEGEGVLLYAAKVKIKEGNQVEVENYGVNPVQLKGVRKL